MDISFYQKESRSTWAETWFGENASEPYTVEYLDHAIKILDGALDNLKKSLFYGEDNDCNPYETEDTLEDLDISRGQKDLLHAILGIATESGELLEAIQPILEGNDQDIDTVNIDEEMGDIYYYLMRMHDVLETDPEDTMGRNLAKLLERYEHGEFNAEDALNRDTDQEREALES